MAHFDRFDIAEAYYLYLSATHRGMFSPEYQRLCKLMRRFKPRPDLRPDTLTDNGKAIYRRLLARKES